MKIIFVTTVALSLGFATFTVASAAPTSGPDTAYEQTTLTRADKIIASLKLDDATKATRVRDEIAQFYRDLNVLQAERDAKLKDMKEKTDLTKETRDAETKIVKDEIETKRTALRQSFVTSLIQDLTSEQIGTVKDGLTYDVYHVTLRAYERMLPDLTVEQKDQINTWLLEARDLAISGFTSDEKHGVFGKYKGRINNYLAKAGINMKESEKALAGTKSQK